MRHLLNILCVQNELFFIRCLSLFYHTSRENELDRGKNWLKSKCKKTFPFIFLEKWWAKNRFELEMDAFGAVANFSVLFCQDFCNATLPHLFFQKKVLKDWTNVGFFKCFLMKGILDKIQDIKSCHLFIWSLNCLNLLGNVI